jgi:hypothetical protein
MELTYTTRAAAEQEEAESDRKWLGVKLNHNNLDGIILDTDELRRWRGVLRLHAMQGKSHYEANAKLEHLSRQGYSRKQIYQLRGYYYRKAISSLKQPKISSRRQ